MKAYPSSTSRKVLPGYTLPPSIDCLGKSLMKTLTNAKVLTHLSWSPKSGDDTVLYLENRENIVVHAVGGSPKTIASGFEPVWLGPDAVAFVRDHTIWAVNRDGSNERLLFDRSAGFENSNKGSPLSTADGKTLLVVIRDITRDQSKWVPDSAYPVRHFYAIGDPQSKTLTPINAWAYGGKAMWLDDGQSFAHHEFDATGGARLHIHKIDGEELACYRGYHPHLSPNGKHIVTVAHAFDSVQIIDVDDSKKLPQKIILPADLSGGRFNNPCFWLDDERLMIEAKNIILELFTDKKKKPIRRAKIEIVRRGLATMALSADRKHIAYESDAGDQSEILIVAVSDWLKETLPEPKVDDEE
jgi:hypothetical protein